MARRSASLLGLGLLGMFLAAVMLNACTHPVPTGAYSLQPADTVPNKISCQFRGEGFCHPRQFNI